MSSLPASRCLRDPRLRAAPSFTLVELLAALAVLVILMALLGNFFALVGSAWSSGKSTINNFTKARAALDIMALDYQLGIFRPDVPAFPNGSNLFYTLRQSSSTVGDIPRSLICYQIAASATNSVLQRAADSVTTIPFTQSTIPAATNFLDMVDGVLKMQLSFVHSDGSVTSTYVEGDKAVGIDLAIVDDGTLSLLVATGKLATLSGDAAFTVNANQTPYQSWQANFNHATGAANPINYTQYPAPIRHGVQFFERYVPLP
jgi:hypothetical protein